MSKITNDDLTRFGTGCFTVVRTVHMTTVGVKRLSWLIFSIKIIFHNISSSVNAELMCI